jgi:hypothetical protein
LFVRINKPVDEKNLYLPGFILHSSCSKETEDFVSENQSNWLRLLFRQQWEHKSVEGPQIGEPYGNYDNVISIHDSYRNKISIDSVLYVVR